MDRNEFYSALDEMLELPHGTITGGSELLSTGKWDSMAFLSFIAMADDQFGTAVAPGALAACATADDLARLLGGKVKADPAG